MNHARKMVLVPEQTLERLKQRDKIQTAPLTSKLKRLDHQMEDLLNSRELSEEEKARRYSQTLQNYLTYYKQRRDEPMKIKFETHPIQHQDKQEPELGNQSQPVPVPRQEVQDKIERDIVSALPKTLKDRGKLLIEKIKENPEIMKWDSRGQLLFEDRPLPGSHIVDLIGDFMRERKGVDPIGWQVFARGLAKMNAPEDLVRNERRRGALREFKSRVGDQDDPSVLFPTPPPTDPPQVPTPRRNLYRKLPPVPLSNETPGSIRSVRSKQPPKRWLTYQP